MCQKKPIRKTRIIPKIICITIATLSIAVIGYFSLSPFWFWICWVFVGAGLVAIGCIGEWYLFINPTPEGDEKLKAHHRRRELQFITAVAIGVTMDFMGLFHEIPEAVRLEKDVVEIGTTNAQLVADNLVSRSNVEKLELQVLQTSNNIVKIDPQNANISEITAFVYFEVKGTNLPINLSDPSNAGLLFLCSGKLIYSNLPNAILFPLVANNFAFGFASGTLTNNHADFFTTSRRAYSLQFHTEGRAAYILNSGSVFPVKKISDVSFLWMLLSFLPNNSEILNGSVEVVVNGSVHKPFKIFPQTAFTDKAGFVPNLVIATNFLRKTNDDEGSNITTFQFVNTNGNEW